MSFPRRRESSGLFRGHQQIEGLPWIPACAGMTLIEQLVERIYALLFGFIKPYARRRFFT